MPSLDWSRVYPLSPAQRGLWFMDKLNPGSPFYTVGLGIRLRGELDVAALGAALGDVVARHEVLRARFITLDGRPYQIFVAEPPRSALPVLDLAGGPDEVKRLLAEHLDRAGLAIFDLGAEPPMRSELLRLADDDHVLLLSIHHIVFDGWSTAVLIADLAAAYAARRRGLNSALAPPPRSFGQIAARREADQQGCDTAAAVRDWRDRLAGALHLELPTDGQRPLSRSFAGSCVVGRVDDDTGRGVRRLAASMGVTPFVVLLAVFDLLLARSAQTSEVVIGVPTAGRTDPDSHALIGLFVNTLPLRLNLAGVSAVPQLIERHRGPVVDLLAAQDLPFDQLVSELNPLRSPGHNPFYDVTFQHLPDPCASSDFGGLAVELLGGRRRTAQFDLSCDITDSGDGFVVQVEFSTEVFSEATAQAVLAEYARLLALASDRPFALPEVAIPFARPAPGQGARSAWGHKVPWADGGLGGVVCRQAGSRPGAPALRDRDRVLSFAELDARAHRIAKQLAGLGVAAGDRVAIMMEPSADAVVAILGVLLAGACYAPVDRHSPIARVEHMLRQAGCDVVLSHEATATCVAGLLARAVFVSASEPADGEVPGPEHGTGVQVTGNSAAYVIFTSGSTGQPKAVLVHHGAAVALCAAAAAAYDLGTDDVVLQAASLSVDVSVEELFASWSAGACVVLQPPELADLDGFVERHSITVLNLPVIRWQTWTQQLIAAGGGWPASLRLVVIGSDRAEAATVAGWQARFASRVRLLNAYGTTETAVTSAAYDTADLRRDAAWTSAVPIGTAFAHADLHVLDGHLRKIGDGKAGELYIGGPGVAMGYLGHPGTTASRFLPDPFSPVPGVRMYRTGDIVRRLPSGALDLIGRADAQVKIHGFRVELAEVERAADGAPGVAQFVADARADDRGINRLVGYARARRSAVASGFDDRRIQEWRQVHDDELFNQHLAGADPLVNTSGWISSYTKLEITAAEMRQWLDATIERLGEGSLGRILEIGCGTGMLLFRLAPHAHDYIGTDISPRALDYVRRHLPMTGVPDGRVRLLLAPAHDLSVLDHDLDLVILNSVVQYFPSQDYFERVLRGIWHRVRPGGRVFIGDVRDLTALPAFHASVRAYRGEASVGALRQAVAEAVETERELCFDPRYLRRLGDLLPAVGLADVRVKRGRTETEMNRYRHDVVLHRKAATSDARRVTAPTVRLDSAALTLDSLADAVAKRAGAVLTLRDVRDARTARDFALAASLGWGPNDLAHQAGPELHPEDIHDLAAEHGATAVVRPAAGGLLDIAIGDPAAVPHANIETGPASAAANTPAQAVRTRELATALRQHLEQALPRHMIPARFVFVDTFPMTASGKVDRRRLPTPPWWPDHRNYLAPRDATEDALCRLWADVLGVDKVGVHANFFEIGGDSITWLQIVSRAARLGMELAARDVFEHQTVAELAAWLAIRAAQAQPAPTALIQQTGLAPIQQWFMETVGAGWQQHNQAQWFRLRGDVSEPALRAALQLVLSRHAALTAEVANIGGQWFQRRSQVRGLAGDALETVRVAVGAQHDSALLAAAERARPALDPERGAMLRAVLARTPADSADLLLMCIHHLAVDAVSWQVILDDLGVALNEGGAGPGTAALPPSADYLQWAALARDEAAGMSSQERSYWRSLANAPALAVPLRNPQGSGRVGDAHKRVINVMHAAPSPAAGRATQARLLAAVAHALAGWSGRQEGTVWVEEHGRPLRHSVLDVSRSVGWFTSLFPFLISADDGFESIRANLDAIPRGGVGYGRLRYLLHEPIAISANVVVTFLGPSARTAVGRLVPAPDLDHLTGPSASPESAMPFAVEVTALQRAGQLIVDCRLSDQAFDVAGAEQFVSEITRHLHQVPSTPPDVVGPARRSAPDVSLVPDAVRRHPLLRAAVERLGAEAAFPLSPMQKMMLYRHMLAGRDDPNYTESVLSLDGAVNRERLAEAWSLVVRRYDALRTSLLWEGLDEPVQIVHADEPAPLRFIDWSELGPGRAERRLRQMLRDERRSPPPLSGRPPFRIAVITITPQRHWLLWIDHHILLDGWSSAIVLRDLLRAYADLTAGRAPLSEAAPAVAYRHYLRWIRDQSTSEARRYWQDQLSGFDRPTPFHFALGPAAHAARAADYADVETTIGSPLGARLTELARTHHVTVGAVFVAAWCALLCRESRENRVVIGVTQNGRPAGLGEVDAMVGLYMSTLPLAVAVGPGTVVASLLQDVARKQAALSGPAGAGSLSDIHEWAAIPVSRTLFQSAVVFQNYRGGADEAADYPLRARTEHARLLTGVPLTLAVDPAQDAIRVVYDARTFQRGTMEQLLNAYRDVLAGFTNTPRAAVSELAISAVQPATRAVASAVTVVPPDPPRGHIEERVAVLWRDVLGIPGDSRAVNLFDAGATSLGAMRLHARLRDDFEAVLPLAELFGNPTIAGISEAIRRFADGGPAAGGAGPSNARDAPRGECPGDRAGGSRQALAQASRAYRARLRATETSESGPSP